MLSWIDGSSRPSDDRRVRGWSGDRRARPARPRRPAGWSAPRCRRRARPSRGPCRRRARSAGTSTEARPSAVRRKSASVGLGAVAALAQEPHLVDAAARRAPAGPRPRAGAWSPVTTSCAWPPAGATSAATVRVAGPAALQRDPGADADGEQHGRQAGRRQRAQAPTSERRHGAARAPRGAGAGPAARAARRGAVGLRAGGGAAARPRRDDGHDPVLQRGRRRERLGASGSASAATRRLRDLVAAALADVRGGARRPRARRGSSAPST